MKNTPHISHPDSFDGLRINELIARCPPLDTNSIYCNLLQSDHFAATSIIAKTDNLAVGFISAYEIPNRTNTLFVWQVAVDESYRGTGLATKMLDALLARDNLAHIDSIETTITPANEASWALFTKLAKRLNTKLSKTEYYQSQQHFQGKHDSEWLVHIGPLSKLTTGE